MDAFIDSKILKQVSHPLRQKILLFIFNNNKTNYNSIKKECAISSGALYFHLKSLGNLISQTATDKLYFLSSTGVDVVNYMIQNENQINLENFNVEDNKKALSLNEIDKIFYYIYIGSIEKAFNLIPADNTTFTYKKLLISYYFELNDLLKVKELLFSIENLQIKDSEQLEWNSLQAKYYAKSKMWSEFLKLYNESSNFNTDLNYITTLKMYYSVYLRESGDINKAIEVLKEQIGFLGTDKIASALFYREFGTNFHLKNDFDNALYGYSNSIEIFSSIPYYLEKAKTMNNLAVLYQDKKDFTKAIEVFEQAHNIFDRLGKKKESIYILINLAILNHDLNNFEKSLSFNKKALEIANELNDIENIAIVNNNMGNIFSLIGEINSAINSYKTAMKLYKNLNIQTDFGTINRNIGKILIELDQLDEAVFHLTEATAVNDMNSIDKLNGLMYLSKAYFEVKNKEKIKNILLETKNYNINTHLEDCAKKIIQSYFDELNDPLLLNDFDTSVDLNLKNFPLKSLVFILKRKTEILLLKYYQSKTVINYENLTTILIFWENIARKYDLKGELCYILFYKHKIELLNKNYLKSNYLLTISQINSQELNLKLLFKLIEKN